MVNIEVIHNDLEKVNIVKNGEMAKTELSKYWFKYDKMYYVEYLTNFRDLSSAILSLN
jgi:hypothetical protein